MFLDADDLLLPNAVEEVVRAWHPGPAKAQFVLAHVDADGRALGESFHTRRRRCPTATSARRFSTPAATSASPPAATRSRDRCSIVSCRCRSQWRQAADTSLEIIAPFLGDVVSIRKTLGCYRIHEANHGMLADDLDARKLRVKIIIDLQREWALSEFATRIGLHGSAQLGRARSGASQISAGVAACRSNSSPADGRSANR